MSGAVEALYIFDEHNDLILSHVFRSRPLNAGVLLPLYLARPAPRPSVIHLPNIIPPTTVFSVVHSRLLFLSPSSVDTEPLLLLEFLHRLVDVLEEFLGAPLLPGKIKSNYDVVAQLMGEMCDGGLISNTEPNTLRDVVEVPGWVGKMLGGVGLPSSSQTPQSHPPSLQPPTLHPPSNAPPIPWRRANVKHTSNELYVDILESLSIIVAPSGRPLSAIANGFIAFTSKISGTPELILTLTCPGGRTGIERAIELPVFHPCVCLARWRDRPGELSFIPPDGKFVLASYEVDLLPEDSHKLRTPKLPLPISLEVKPFLGPTRSEFEVRLLFSATASSTPSSSDTSARASLRARLGTPSPSFNPSSSSANLSATQASSLEDLLVTVPLPRTIRNISEIRASRGEASHHPEEGVIEWRIPNLSGKGASGGGATLRCTVLGDSHDDDGADADGIRVAREDPEISDPYAYSYQAAPSPPPSPPAVAATTANGGTADKRQPMPTSARLSFTMKNTLASGVRVESLVLDQRRSRGIGEGVRPYKGVKYLTVCREGKGQGGWEVRC